MAEESPGGTGREAGAQLPHEIIFQRLPPLDSPEFIQFVKTAPVSDLPPEVLVRVFRQLPPVSPTSRIVLERLFQKRGACWDYLGSVVALARRRSKRFPRDDYQDLLQDAVERILRILPTERGRYAERSWNAFCYRELIEAWRVKYGRRGERYPLEEQADDENKELQDLAIYCRGVPPWHGLAEPNAIAEIEGVALRTIDSIQDDFQRAVAKEAWFRDRHPKVSGNSKDDGDPPLTSVFPGSSRFQIARALRYVNAQLAAELLAEPSLEWTDDLRCLLDRLKNFGPVAASAPEE